MRSSPCGILQQHLAVEHHHLGALGADADQEFGALRGRVDERRIDLQRARPMAEEINRPDQQIEQRAPLLGAAAQLGRGALIHPQGRIVRERKPRAARGAGPERVTEAESLLEHRGGPHVSARALQLDRALDRDQTGIRRLAERLRLGQARRHEKRPCKGGRGQSAVRQQPTGKGPRAHARSSKAPVAFALGIINCANIRLTWIELPYNGFSPCDGNLLPVAFSSSSFAILDFYFCSSWITPATAGGAPVR